MELFIPLMLVIFIIITITSYKDSTHSDLGTSMILFSSLIVFVIILIIGFI